MSENTLSSYTNGVRRFEAFRLNRGFPTSWPPTTEHIVLFLSALSLQGLSSNTARQYKCAISCQCKLLGHTDTTDSYITNKVLHGMQKSKATASTRLPITANLLSNILRVLPVTCTNMYESSLFTAAFTTAFFGFLRVGELTVTSPFLRERVVSIDDVLLDRPTGSLHLRIRGSKTDQDGQGHVIKMHKTGKPLCPILSFEQFIIRRPNLQGPLFCHLNGTPVTRTQFSLVLKKALSSLQIDYGKYNTHSFRIGAATTAAMVGYTTEEIMAAGRWKSKAVESYVKISQAHEMPKLN